MDILAFVDTHSSEQAMRKVVKKAEKADIIICGGDVSIFGHGQNEALKELNRIGKPVLIIHGNHENRRKFAEMCERLKNLVYIHNRVHTIGEYSFIGYGDGGFSLRDPEFLKLAKRELKNIPKNNRIILVSHGPPYGTKVDMIDGNHAGSKDIRKFIELFKPILLITGHLHENEGRTDKIGNTRIINPGMEGVILKV